MERPSSQDEVRTGMRLTAEETPMRWSLVGATCPLLPARFKMSRRCLLKPCAGGEALSESICLPIASTVL
jgi:hypothetical protein